MVIINGVVVAAGPPASVGIGAGVGYFAAKLTKAALVWKICAGVGAGVAGVALVLATGGAAEEIISDYFDGYVMPKEVSGNFIDLQPME